MKRFLWLLILCFAVLCNGAEEAFDWAKVDEMFPGIRHVFLQIESPRLMKINVIQVDLSNPKVKFITTPRDPDWGKPMPDYPERTIRTRRQTARSFFDEARRPVAEGGRGLNMVIAVNASPWTPWCKPFNHQYADWLGFVVSDGELVSDGNGNGAFIIYKDGRTDIKPMKKGADYSDIELAVAGFGMVLTDGVAKGDTALHPRTGLGLSQDRRYFYIITIDGRQPGYSEGATTREVGEYLRYFGSFVGVNMDGGGSTTLLAWLPDEAGKMGIRRLNHAKGERRLSNALGIYLLDKAE